MKTLSDKMLASERDESEGYYFTDKEAKEGDRWEFDSQFNYHKEDGPAVHLVSGYKAWWNHGKRHREDGPAVIYTSGKLEYWLHGTRVSRKQVMGQ